MTTVTKCVTIADAEAELALLAEEEASIPGLREAVTQQLAEAQRLGEFHKAAVLAAELADLSGPKMERLALDREKASRALWDALAETLEQQALALERRSLAQLALEDKARERLEQVSGCSWVPKQTRVEIQGLSRVVTDRPLSAVWQAQADYRKQLASRLRVPNPDRFGNVTQEALRLVSSPEN